LPRVLRGLGAIVVLKELKMGHQSGMTPQGVEDE